MAADDDLERDLDRMFADDIREDLDLAHL